MTGSLRSSAAGLPAVAILGVFVVAGGLGVDFGRHWDEFHHRDNVARAVLNHRVLPGWYTYPSVTHWLTFAGALPGLSDALDRGAGAARDYVQQDPGPLLRARYLFICLTGLGALWLYLFFLRWRNSAFEATLAAGFYAGSWELGYHARWIAPDAVLTQFAAGYLAMYGLAVLHRSPKWLLGAAAAAGLAAGTKYNAGLLVPALMAGAFVVVDGKRRGAQLALQAGVVSVLVYIVSTPGTVLEPAKFWAGFLDVFDHYSRRGHGGYSVASGLEHLQTIAIYVSSQLLSKWAAVSLVLFGVAVFGAIEVARRDAPMMWPLLAFVVLYVAVVSTQRIFFARNLLILTPFVAALCARGAGGVLERIDRRDVRFGVRGALVAVLIANAAWQLKDGWAIRNRGDRAAQTQLVVDYVRAHPGEVYVTREVRYRLTAIDVDTASIPVASRFEDATSVAMLLSDLSAPSAPQPANLPGLIDRPFGPWTVNLDYYTTWLAEPVVLVPADRLARFSIRR